jgi:hypothetical protein
VLTITMNLFQMITRIRHVDIRAKGYLENSGKEKKLDVGVPESLAGTERCALFESLLVL